MQSRRGSNNWSFKEPIIESKCWTIRMAFPPALHSVMLFFVKINLLGAVFFALTAGSFRLNAQTLTHENCGVNSAIVVLNRFGFEAEPTALVATLGVGSDLSSPTNFEALSALFKQKGLNCYKLKGASLAEVIDLSNKDALALIQTHKPPWEHFFVFCPSSTV